METPRVNPVGVVEYPAGYVASPRRFSPPLRLFAGLLLLFFLAVTVGTSALTLGAYCLTSDGGDVRVLRESVQRWTAPRPAADGSSSTTPVGR